MSFSPIVFPAQFAQSLAAQPARAGVSGDSWLRELPGLIADLAAQWGLRVDGDARYQVRCVTVPYLRDGEPVTVKVNWPRPDARFEHLALRQWDGRGAVRLLAADPARWALLLERVDYDVTLESLPVLAACEALGGLFHRLDAAPVARVDDLPAESERWVSLCKAGSPVVPRRMTQQAASMLRDLGPDSGKDLVHTNLHYAHSVASVRYPWLAVDPAPINGEWEFAVAPALWTRWKEAMDADNLRAHLRSRLGVICDAGGLNEERAQAWSFVRLVLRAMSETDDSAPDQEALSRYVAAAKAMLD